MIAPEYPQRDKRHAQEMVPLDFHFLAECHPATFAARDPNAGWLTYGCRSGMGGLVSAGVGLSFYLGRRGSA
jgi:hypothetical protein